MQTEIEQLKNYIRIVWIVLLFVFIAVIIELLFGIINWIFVITSLVSLVLASIINLILRKNASEIEKNLEESKKSRKESEDSKKALINVISDLAKSRDELEARVKERTIELEEIKNGLEQKVNERTADLEKSRIAILHMLGDLKMDLAKLEEVDRMKNEFISVISHELRTPLTPLMDYASILIEGFTGPSTKEQMNIYKSMLRLSKRELALINGLIDISRLELGGYTPKKTPLRLAELINDSIIDIQPEAQKKNIEVSFESQENLPTIMADENLIARVIAQFLNNALKFTPEGGRIRINCRTEGDKLRFEISDTGIGIEKEKIGNLFQKFYQADSSFTRKFGGLGLGLAICKNIVEIHRGKIWAESEGLGRGTTFIILLPINQ